MKSTPIELISTLRKKISFQTVIALLLMSAMIITGFLLFGQAGKFSSAVLTSSLLLFLTSYMIVMRHRTMLKLLDPTDPRQTVENLGKHIHDRMDSFSSTTIIRIVFGIVCAIGMILLLYYKPSSHLGATMGVMLVFVVLMSMLIGWVNMQDSIMVQDLKHCQRNHPSEIS